MGQKDSKLSPEEVEELEKRTRFDVDEIKALFKGFKRDCPKGVLSIREFKNIYSSYAQTAGDSGVFVEHVFRTYDTDNSGEIDFKEFVNALSVMTRGQLEEKLKWAFSMYDLDGNGNISRSEMLEIMKAIYKMRGSMKLEPDEATPELRTDKMMKIMDTNNDGEISREEFVEGARNDPSIIKLLQPGAKV